MSANKGSSSSSSRVWRLVGQDVVVMSKFGDERGGDECPVVGETIAGTWMGSTV